MAIKNIIFDFDGTLADTSALIVATIQTTIQQLGLPEKTEPECQSVIGLRLEEVASVLWPDIADLNESFAACYRQTFEALKSAYRVTCYPGVIALLQQLRAAGYGLAIASSRGHRSLAAYTDEFGITDNFSLLIGGDDVAVGKPAPDPVLAILAAQHWSAAETLTVGDMAVDIQMGRRAGTRTCGVTYGNGSRPELEAAGADWIIDHFPDLLSVLAAG